MRLASLSRAPSPRASGPSAPQCASRFFKLRFPFVPSTSLWGSSHSIFKIFWDVQMFLLEFNEHYGFASISMQVLKCNSRMSKSRCWHGILQGPKMPHNIYSGEYELTIVSHLLIRKNYCVTGTCDIFRETLKDVCHSFVLESKILLESICLSRCRERLTYKSGCDSQLAV